MNGDLREYARLGLAYHMLYSACTRDPDFHVETLCAFCRRGDIELLDCCIPYGAERRRRVVAALRGCGKEVVCTLHLFPLRKISLGSRCPQEQAQTRLIVADQIAVAAEAGAAAYIFASGADDPTARDEATAAFATFCQWFAEELKPHGIRALLEPFDRTIDKKFLMGPTADCAALVRSLRPVTTNLGLELDLAHLPLMGETSAQAVANCRPYLEHVHLGNCVLRDPAHPWYGDRHPPIGLPGGEIEVPQVAEFLRLLLEAGYLQRERRARLVLEMQPFPGRSVEDTIQDNIGRVEQAWSMV